MESLAFDMGQEGPPNRRSVSCRQREDLVFLAKIRASFALSRGTYGSPRMARELWDEGFSVGRRRLG